MIIKLRNSIVRFIMNRFFKSLGAEKLGSNGHRWNKKLSLREKMFQWPDDFKWQQNFQNRKY